MHGCAQTAHFRPVVEPLFRIQPLQYYAELLWIMFVELLQKASHSVPKFGEGKEELYLSTGVRSLVVIFIPVRFVMTEWTEKKEKIAN